MVVPCRKGVREPLMGKGSSTTWAVDKTRRLPTIMQRTVQTMVKGTYDGQRQWCMQWWTKVRAMVHAYDSNIHIGVGSECF